MPISASCDCDRQVFYIATNQKNVFIHLGGIIACFKKVCDSKFCETKSADSVSNMIIHLAKLLGQVDTFLSSGRTKLGTENVWIQSVKES